MYDVNSTDFEKKSLKNLVETVTQFRCMGEAKIVPFLCSHYALHAHQLMNFDDKTEFKESV